MEAPRNVALQVPGGDPGLAPRNVAPSGAGRDLGLRGLAGLEASPFQVSVRLSPFSTVLPLHPQRPDFIRCLLVPILRTRHLGVEPSTKLFVQNSSHVIGSACAPQARKDGRHLQVVFVRDRPDVHEIMTMESRQHGVEEIPIESLCVLEVSTHLLGAASHGWILALAVGPPKRRPPWRWPGVRGWPTGTSPPGPGLAPRTSPPAGRIRGVEARHAPTPLGPSRAYTRICNTLAVSKRGGQESSMSAATPCAKCGSPSTPPQGIAVRRTCEECGGPVYVPPGPEGLKVQKGDEVVVGNLRLSLDRDVTSGRFFRPGVTWFVSQLVAQSAPKHPDFALEALEILKDQADAVLESSPILSDLDLENEGDAKTAVDRVEKATTKEEYWAMRLGAFVQVANEAVEESNPAMTAYAVHHAMNAWTMLVFLQQLEPIVWRGYQSFGVGALRKVLEEWEANQDRAEEGYWQGLLEQYPFVVSQVLAYPVVILRGRAFVGGKTLDNSGGHVVDLALAHRLTKNIALLELKTPVTKLLGRQYRTGVFPPSTALTGAVAQVMAYRDSLLREPELLRRESDRMYAFVPECIVLIGRTDQLDSDDKRRSFQLYRSQLLGVTVLTFDELFENIRGLLEVIQGSS